MAERKLLAVDPSLTCSGWAVFYVDSRRLAGVGKLRSLPPEVPMARRLANLQERVTQLFERLKLGAADVLVCEAATTMRDPRAAMLVEQVRGIFETIARGYALTVPGRLNPRSVQYEILGLKGRQMVRAAVKESAAHAAGSLYGEDLRRLGFESSLENLRRHQDIVDAILVGGLALTRVSAAQAAGLDLEEYFDERMLHSRSGLRRLAGRRHRKPLRVSSQGVS